MASKEAPQGAASEKSGTFSADERAAMVERAMELREEKRRKASREDKEQAVLDKIAAMPEPDRSLAQRLHAIITDAAPELTPRLWYGMPAYARGEKVVCFFNSASKFKERYSTLGFSGSANLDDGPMWATSYAITELDDAVEARVAELVRKASG